MAAALFVIEFRLSLVRASPSRAGTRWPTARQALVRDAVLLAMAAALFVIEFRGPAIPSARDPLNP